MSIDNTTEQFKTQDGSSQNDHVQKKASANLFDAAYDVVAYDMVLNGSYNNIFNGTTAQRKDQVDDKADGQKDAAKNMDLANLQMTDAFMTQKELGQRQFGDGAAQDEERKLAQSAEHQHANSKEPGEISFDDIYAITVKVKADQSFDNMVNNPHRFQDNHYRAA